MAIPCRGKIDYQVQYTTGKAAFRSNQDLLELVEAHHLVRLRGNKGWTMWPRYVPGVGALSPKCSGS
jgi:hypothetical protein